MEYGTQVLRLRESEEFGLIDCYGWVADPDTGSRARVLMQARCGCVSIELREITPDQARELARRLMQAADEADGVAA